MTIPNKYLSWMSAIQAKTSSGELFEWDNHRFMIEPMTDMHPHQGWNKCAQVGASEMMICKVVYLSMECGLNVLYALQSASAMDDFVKGKLDPIIRANSYFVNKVSGNTSIKTVDFKGNERFIHLVGAYNSEASSKQEQTSKGVSKTADILIADEASRSDQYVLNQTQSRLMNSKYGYVWYFDNPSYPGMGADKIFQQSDQMYWIVTCSHCGWKQYLDWFRLDQHEFRKAMHCYVDVENECLVCGKCQKPLSDDDRKYGEWVQKYPDKGGWILNGKKQPFYSEGAKPFGFRGYWINQLAYTHHSISKLLKLDDPILGMTKSVFANMIMGKPYIGSDIKITRDTILNNIRPSAFNPKKGEVFMGVDTKSSELEYVLRDKEGMFKYGRAGNMKEIYSIRDMYDAFAIIDANPMTGAAKEFCARYPRKVRRAVYKPESDQTELVRESANDDTLILIRREEMFDVIADLYNSSQMPINMTPTQLSEFMEHWGNLIRITDEDNQGNHRFRWDQSTGATDFAHCDLYSYVAMMYFRKGDISMFTGKSTSIDPNVQPVPWTPKEIIENSIRDAGKRK